MRAAVTYGAGDVRIETVPDPKLVQPTDAVVRIVRACVCGSDLHPHHQMETTQESTSKAHEVLDGRLEPGKVFDRTVDLDGVPAGYRAMDARESLKVLVQP